MPDGYTIVDVGVIIAKDKCIMLYAITKVVIWTVKTEYKWLFLILGECNNALCLNHGRCMSSYSQRCACQNGFQGSRCEYGK